jgi:hypothetical protein
VHSRWAVLLAAALRVAWLLGSLRVRWPHGSNNGQRRPNICWLVVMGEVGRLYGVIGGVCWVGVLARVAYAP